MAWLGLFALNLTEVPIVGLLFNKIGVPVLDALLCNT
jgi:hypothetical protein